MNDTLKEIAYMLWGLFWFGYAFFERKNFFRVMVCLCLATICFRLSIILSKP